MAPLTEAVPRDIVVRPAHPADAASISLVHRSDVIAWKGWDAEGRSIWSSHDRLTPAERWMNGGPWMDEGLCRRHLEHMTSSPRIALVAEVDGTICAEAEAFQSDEPLPFGNTFNLAVLYTRRGFAGRGLGSALMRALLNLARERECETLSVSSASASGFYSRFGLACWQRWQQLVLPASARNIVYQRQACGLAPAPLPAGWGMALGGIGSAAQMWDRLDARDRPAPAEQRDAPPVAFELSRRSGRERARLVLEPKAHEPSAVAAFLWTPDGRLSPRMCAAVGDCAARTGFAEIHTWWNLEHRTEVPADARWGQEVREVWGVRL